MKQKDPLTLTKAAKSLEQARMAMAVATTGARIAAVQAAADGVPETRIAQTLGVARTTVREWLAREAARG